MDIQAEKIALAKLILDTDDADILVQIKSFLQTENEQGNDFPAYVEKGITESIGQANRGEFISFDDVKKEVALLLKK